MKVPSITSPLVPRGVKHAVAAFKSKICSAIEECLKKGDIDGQIRAWKGLFAMDALLYNESHQDRKAKSRTALISEKLSLMEEGHWGTVWALMMDIEKPINQITTTPMSARSRGSRASWTQAKEAGRQHQCGEEANYPARQR